MSSTSIYIIAILVLIVGILIVKKITSCMFRLTITAIVVIILAVLYFMYCR